ncbi:MAG: hypothetical protein R3F04_05425 [Lysobacteraceae bacterium]|nr:hypothetical protein [Xanthomonadales bacterium]
MAIFSRVRCWCLALLLPSSALAIGGYMTLDMVDPAVYASADGRSQWRIDPLLRSGSGEARYELSLDGELQRSLTLPYTLLQAKVTREGLLIGHALHGETHPGYGYRDCLVARVQVDGRAEVLWREARQSGNGLHTNDVPYPIRSALDEAQGRFLLEIEVIEDNDRQVQTWAFDLAGSGEKHRHPDPLPAAPERAESSSPLGGRRLRSLGQSELQLAPHQVAPLATHYDFRIDEAGRFGLLRWTSERSCAFVLADAGGAVLHRWPLLERASGCPSTLKLHWIEGDRWLLTNDEDNQSQGWWLDAESGEVAVVEGFSPPPIHHLEPDGEGGFVAVLSIHEGWTVTTMLAKFDADGRQRWSHKIDFGGNGLAQTGGEAPIAVLNLSDIDRYARDGSVVDRIELSQVMGRQLNYAAGLRAGRDASLWLEDFGGRYDFVQLDAQGVVIAQLKAVDEAGKAFESVGGLQQAPDGTFWTSNGRELLQLDAQGRVVQRAPAASHDGLTLIDAMQISPAGDIHALDRYGGAIHRFDARGQWVDACHPDPGDYTKNPSLASLALSPAGQMLVDRRDEPPDALLYGSDCRRLAVQRPHTDEYQQSWHFADGPERYWIVGDEGITLVDRGQPMRRIERTPAGNWLRLPGPVTTDASGDLITHVTRMPLQDGAQPPVHQASFIVWSSQGQALAEIPAPDKVQPYSGLSTDGTRLAYLLDSDEVVVQDRRSGQAYRVLDIPFVPRAAFLVQPAGSPELWIWDGEWRIERRALE